MPNMLQEVPIAPQPFERWAEYTTPERMAELRRASEAIRRRLTGRVLWTLNSTSVGGGVAELLHPLMAYVRGAGIDARWWTISGPPDFFKLTKRLHNALHGGQAEAEWPLEADRRLYEETLFQNALELAGLVRPRDIVLLHDPQTVGLTPHLTRLGARVIWRCHIGHDELTDSVRHAWRFLLPYLETASAFVFTRASYIPLELVGKRVVIIPPTIDPSTPKNQPLTGDCVRAILARAGLLAGDPAAQACFVRSDGTPGRVDRSADIIRLGSPPSAEVPLVVQVSRWDRLKDPLGVLRGFASSEELLGLGSELVLAGPTVNAVSDDPEGAAVFNEVLAEWRGLGHHQRRRVHLANLPMADAEENAAIVNALQRHAAVVVQKSLHEGFGLTVTEAMWKGRPVVASAVGGIQDQLDDGVTGLLLRDPRDLGAFAHALRRLLEDPALASRLGHAARERVREHFIGLASLLNYAHLIEAIET